MAYFPYACDVVGARPYSGHRAYVAPRLSDCDRRNAAPFYGMRPRSFQPVMFQPPPPFLPRFFPPRPFLRRPFLQRPFQPPPFLPRLFPPRPFLRRPFPPTPFQPRVGVAAAGPFPRDYFRFHQPTQPAETLDSNSQLAILNGGAADGSQERDDAPVRARCTAACCVPPVPEPSQRRNAPMVGAGRSARRSVRGDPTAKLPKTVACATCDKWYTTEMHLKRHLASALHQQMSKRKQKGIASSRPPTDLSPRSSASGDRTANPQRNISVARTVQQ